MDNKEVTKHCLKEQRHFLNNKFHEQVHLKYKADVQKIITKVARK